MLDRLSIQNYTLIDRLELRFDKGLNIVTGETGAGKSILLGALSLILGQRADSSVLPDKNKKSIVEGEFTLNAGADSIHNFFRQNELDPESTIILRREISSEGKSRAFINDTPVNLQQLKELGSLLIDIHSQHESLLLNKSGFQLSIVDAFAETSSAFIEYTSLYKEYSLLQKKLNDLTESEKKSKADQNYFQFQFNELYESKLVKGEEEVLESELKTLTHAEEIGSVLSSIEQELSGAEDNILRRAHTLSTQLKNLSKYQQELSAISERLDSSIIELKDISSELEIIAANTSSDPGRTQVITERLNLIYQLQQKHRVNSSEALLEVQKGFEEKLDAIGSLEEEITKLNKESEVLKSKIQKLAREISGKRNSAIPKIEQNIKKLLKELGMPNAILKIDNKVADEGFFNAGGIDSIRFLFSANKGMEYADISKTASGGELSRLMLCLKSSVARLMELPSLVFDEIDTGVSGETAFKIGKLMEEMATGHQLIVITHLPQIAGKGTNHFYVYKEVSGGKTFTRVKNLAQEERVLEVARMLSGEKPTPVAVENARELMKS